MKKCVIKTNQIILWFVTQLLLILTLSGKKVYLKHSQISSGSSYLIVANHQRRLDPFFICACLPFKLFIALKPINFMAHWGFFQKPPLKWLLLSLGAYPNKPFDSLGYGLQYSTEALRKGESVFIFPEGKRVKGEKVQARHGVSVLAAEPNVQCILCHIEWRKGWWPGFTVTISEPLNCAGLGPEKILDTVYKLE